MVSWSLGESVGPSVVSGAADVLFSRPQRTCHQCRTPEQHPNRVLHQQINLLASRLDEQLLARITGLNRCIIRRGCRELDAELTERARAGAWWWPPRVRGAGPGPSADAGGAARSRDDRRPDGPASQRQAQLIASSEYGPGRRQASREPSDGGTPAAPAWLLAQGECPTQRGAQFAARA